MVSFIFQPLTLLAVEEFIQVEFRDKSLIIHMGHGVMVFYVIRGQAFLSSFNK